MRQKWFAWMGALALAICAAPAHAVTYEDSFEECNYPKTFDLVVMRPISMVTMVAGTALFIPLAPLSLITVGSETATVFDNLVAAPARFTFQRGLGQCNSIDLTY
jgi:hypothetical protein